MRLDKYILQKFLLKSRTFSENVIIKGKVKVNGLVVTKPSFDVSDKDEVEISVSDEFASLGGDKLNKAIKEFSLNLANKKCVDIGASNGGFTDCMLRNGAKTVYSVDVADCALPQNLKNDQRVYVKDNVNARYIKDDDVDGKCDFLTVDVSFISLKLVLPSCLNLLNENGEAVCLIKPQFELGKRAGKNGIVLNPKDRLTIVNDIIDFVNSLGFNCVNITTVPKNFENKNIEYLVYITRQKALTRINNISIVQLNNL